jgi:hypothetical protein
MNCPVPICQLVARGVYGLWWQSHTGGSTSRFAARSWKFREVGAGKAGIGFEAVRYG